MTASSAEENGFKGLLKTPQMSCLSLIWGLPDSATRQVEGCSVVTRSEHLVAAHLSWRATWFLRLQTHSTHEPGLIHTAAPRAKTSCVCRKSQDQPRATSQIRSSQFRRGTPCHRAMYHNDLKHQNGAKRLADETRGFQLYDYELKLAIYGFQKERR